MTPTKPTLLSFIREFWLLFLFALAFIGLVVAYILRSLTPPTPVDQPNTWNQITPGYSKLSDVTAGLGEPLSIEQTPQGQKLTYQSQYPTLPNSVVVDPSNTVQFIKEYLPLDKFEQLDSYTQQFGDADEVLYDETTGDIFRAYVYLQQGLVLIVHTGNNSVQQKWYFQPTTRETFLSAWGESLSPEPEGPEIFTPID